MRTRSHPRSLRRAGAGIAAGALTLAGFAVLAPAPAAHADPGALDSGADWLASRLRDGLLHSSYRDPEGNLVEFVDHGATIEAAYSLAATGTTDPVAGIVTAMEGEAENYTAPGDDVYAGSTGKLLSLVTDHAPAEDPRAFGGLDLVAQLEARTADSGPAAGRISDQSAWGDFSNAFGQAWAVRGLSNAGSPEAAAALDFLLLQQCEAGFFRLNLAAADAADQSCDGADPAEQVPPVDTTAVVVVLLHDLADGNPELTAALDRAVAWIVGEQTEDGSFDGGTATEGANTNSTGLAGRALHLAGETEAAARAATWIRQYQAPGLDCDGGLADQGGAIAYDTAAYASGIDEGITADTAGQWQFATIQALPALEAAPTATRDLTLRIPEFLDGGSRERIRVLGLAPGERGCASAGSRSLPVIGDETGRAVARIRLPDRTGFVGVEVSAAEEAVGTEAPVLGSKTLPVRLDEKVAPRRTQRVVVRGLFRRESVIVRNAGDVVARGRADEGGRFVARFEVPRQGGEYRVAVRGEFADRTGTASYRVG